MAWQDKLASRSSHRSAQPATRRPTPAFDTGEVSKDETRNTVERKEVQDAWTVRYNEDPNLRLSGATVKRKGSTINFKKLNSLKPGTPEFTARYIPKPEPVIERIQPHGPEGFATIKVDGYSGEVLDSTPTPLPTPGPGEIMP